MKAVLIIATVAIVVSLGFIALARLDAPQAHSEQTEVANFLPSPQEVVAGRVTLPDPVLNLPHETVTNTAALTNFWSRLIEGNFPKLTREQIEPFLAKNNRSVEALLGALRASGDPDLWKELKEKFPNDPRVQFAAAFKNDSPEERQQWLEKLKQSDPDNALANYLLAGQYLKAGNTEQALAELAAANSKRTMENYLVDFMQNAEEAYRAAGYSSAEAKAIAAESALLPELAHLKGTAVDFVELAKRYQQAGDQSSAQTVLQLALNLGHRLDESPQITLIQELVGLAIERKVLDAMDPSAPYGDTGRTVKEQVEMLAARRAAYKELVAKTNPIFKMMSAEDFAHFCDRSRIYGSEAAHRWVLNQAPAQ